MPTHSPKKIQFNCSILTRIGGLFEIGSILAFLISLCLPAFQVVGGSSYTGYEAFSDGAFLFLLIGNEESLFFSFAWYANVAFFVGQLDILIARRPLRALFAAITSLVLGGGFALAKGTTLEGGGDMHAIHLRSGYILWILSMFLMLLSAAVGTWNTAERLSFIQSKKAFLISGLISISYIVLGLLLLP